MRQCNEKDNTKSFSTTQQGVKMNWFQFLRDGFLSIVLGACIMIGIGLILLGIVMLDMLIGIM